MCRLCGIPQGVCQRLKQPPPWTQTPASKRSGRRWNASPSFPAKFRHWPSLSPAPTSFPASWRGAPADSMRHDSGKSKLPSVIHRHKRKNSAIHFNNGMVLWILGAHNKTNRVLQFDANSLLTLNGLMRTGG